MRLPDRPEAGPIDAGASARGRDNLDERLSRLPDGHPSSPRSAHEDLGPDGSQADDLDLDQDGAEPPEPDTGEPGTGEPGTEEPGTGGDAGPQVPTAPAPRLTAGRARAGEAYRPWFADGGPADPWFAADLAGPATPDD